MFFTKIAKYMCIFTLIMLPNFSFAAMHGLKGRYFNNNNYTDQTSKNIENPKTSYYKSLTSYLKKGEPFKGDDGAYYVDPNLDFGWGGWATTGREGCKDSAMADTDGRQPKGYVKCSAPGINNYNQHTDDVPLGRPYQIEAGSWHDSSQDWSVIWEGYLYLDQVANYQFWAQAKDTFALFIDDRKVGEWGASTFGAWSKIGWSDLPKKDLTLNAGFHKIKVKFSKITGNGYFRLGYTDRTHTPGAVIKIPAENFYTSIPRQVSFVDGSFGAVEGETMKVGIKIDKKPDVGEEIAINYTTSPITTGSGKYATENSDYTGTKGTLIFTSETNTTLYINIPIAKDSNKEGTEIFDINLSNGKYNADKIITPSAIGEIFDFDSPAQIEFAKTKIYTKEPQTTEKPAILKVPIRLTRPLTSDVQVTVEVTKTEDSTADSKDYSLVQNIVTIKRGERMGYAEIAIINDGKIEPKFENFFIKLTNPKNVNIGSLNTAEIIIEDMTDYTTLNKCFAQSDDDNSDAKADGWNLIKSDEDLRVEYKTKEVDFTFYRRKGIFPTFTPSKPNDWGPYYSTNNDTKEKRLRLSEGRNDKTTGISHNTRFPAKNNFISLEFNLHAYGGCVLDSYPSWITDDCRKPTGMRCRNLLGSYSRYGGDGISLVLYDANEEKPNIGGGGGSLGYAQRKFYDPSKYRTVYQNGFAGGWLGVGLDMFGNNINPTEGRKRGLKTGSEGPIAFGNEGGVQELYKGSVVIRGSGDGMNGYRYLASYFPLNNQDDPYSINKPLGRFALKPIAYDDGSNQSWDISHMLGESALSTRIATDYDAGKFRLSIDNVDPKHTWIKLERAVDCVREGGRDSNCKKDANGDDIPDYKIIIENFDAQDSSYGQAPLPSNLKLAFTSSTGRYCNIMETAKISIRANSCEPIQEFNDFRVIEKIYAEKNSTTEGARDENTTFNWKWNSPLRTKTLGSVNSYCVLAGDSKDENASAQTADQNVSLEMWFDRATRIHKNADMNSTYEAVPISQPDRYNFRYLNLKTGNEEPFPADKNITIYGKDKHKLFCFDINTSKYYQGAESQLGIASRDIYFFVRNLKKSALRFYSSDSFALRPNHYKLDFKDLAANKVLLPNDKNETILKSGVNYIINSKAVYKDSNDSSEGYFSVIPSKYGNYSSNDDYSMLKAILVDRNTSTDLICAYDSNVTLGKIISSQDESTTNKNSQIFKQFIRDGKLNFKASDDVKDWNSNEDEFTFSKMYDNTMKFDVVMKDKAWTIVDFNKTKSNFPSESEVKRRAITYGLECDGYRPNGISDNEFKRARELYGIPPTCDINQTMPQTVYFTPDHFVGKLKGLNDAVVRGTDSFTYVSTEENLTHPMMSADMNLTIQAMTFLDHVATNYKELCYANDVDFNITFAPHKNLSRTALVSSDINLTNERRETYLAKPHIWYAGDKYDTNTTHFVRKTPTSTDENATFRIMNKDFKNGEANASVSFNFKRRPNLALEPFSISDRDFDLIGISDANYTNRNLNSEAMPRNKGVVYDINATKMGFTTTHKPSINQITSPTDNFYERPTAESNATFYTARAYTPDYKGTMGTPIDGTTYYGVYCQECDKAQYDLDTFMSIPLQPLWLVNERHNQLSPDGNISSYESVGSGIKNTMTIPSTRQSSTAMTLGRERLEFRSNTPGIDTIKMNMSPWLVYIQDPTSMTTNPNDANITFNVQFYDQSEWGGEGRIDGASEVQGATVDVNESITNRPSRKMSW